jgi:ATP-dependent Clp protease ATP-binding subunit ClpA
MFFNENMEMLPKESEYVLQQTIGFQRVIQRAVNHVRSAEKKEVAVSDILASIFMEKESHAVFFLNEEGISRLDVLRVISHELPGADHPDEEPETETRRTEILSKKKASPLEAYTVNLIDRAAKGTNWTRLIGRELEMERTMQVLCRRRKTTLFSSVIRGLEKPPWPKDWPRKSGLAVRSRTCSKRCGFIRWILAGMLAGSKFRGISSSASRAWLSELKKRKGCHPVHRRDPHHRGCRRHQQRIHGCQQYPQAVSIHR